MNTLDLALLSKFQAKNQLSLLLWPAKHSISQFSLTSYAQVYHLIKSRLDALQPISLMRGNIECYTFRLTKIYSAGLCINFATKAVAKTEYILPFKNGFNQSRFCTRTATFYHVYQFTDEASMHNSFYFA